MTKTPVRPLQRLFGGLSIAALLVSLFFISFNLTGSSIGADLRDIRGIASTCLFVLGLVFTLFYFKERNKAKKNQTP